MAIVMGILSMIDERIAVLQRTMRAVMRILFSIPPIARFARYSSTPAASSHPTIIKREEKNKKTESSSFLRYFCGLS